jgi:EAL domain-containing protein (putative c-di-GMP-specific phosphodiesterase class I)
LFDAAERLARIHDVGRAVRHCVSQRIPTMPAEVFVFVNMHPRDLLDENLFDGDAPLSRFASRVILELTERASLGAVNDLVDRIARLRGMGYRLAVDNVGAGYAGLKNMALLEPEFLKLNMSLIRDIHLKPLRRHLVQSMAYLARELGIWAVAEGVERGEELETLAALGFDLVQGYYVGRPQRDLFEPTVRRLLPVVPGHASILQ